ncbi:MAG: hypothetical protein RJA59_273, partial [Pseudomonadota bacterium]
GRSARVDFGYFTLSPSEAIDFARDLLDAARRAERLPSLHQNHVNLKASCALCRHEAGSQIDRLDWSEEEEA